MYQGSKLTVVGKITIRQAGDWHERPLKPAFLGLAEWSSTAAASALSPFTGLLLTFKWKLAEIGGDHVCIYLGDLGDPPRAHWVSPAELRAKRADCEGSR